MRVLPTMEYPTTKKSSVFILSDYSPERAIVNRVPLYEISRNIFFNVYLVVVCRYYQQ